MESTDKINLFKERTLSERFSAASAFTKQNWKIIAKNLLYVGIPLSLVMSYLSNRYVNAYMDALTNENYFAIFVPIAILGIVSIFFYLFITGMTGAIMQKYQSGELTKNSGWSELGSTTLSLMGKFFVQGLLISIVFTFIAVLIAIPIAFLAPALDTNSPALIAIIIGFALIFILTALALSPSLTLITMPIMIENKNVVESITKGFRLGFKYWGSTLLTIGLGGLIYAAISFVFSVPYSIVGGITAALPALGETGTMVSVLGVLSFILACVSYLGILFIYPIYLVFLGLQYTSVVEREEGITLTQNIDSFDNL